MNVTLAPRFEDSRAMLLAGLRQHHKFDEAAAGIPAQWQRFLALDLPMDGVPTYGVMCGTDQAERRFEYMCAVEVPSFESVRADIGRMRIPAQHYAVFTHKGHVATLRQTWDAIWSQWLPTSGFRPASTPDFERYDERFNPMTGEGVIEIWFPVEKRSGA
jgi:AraC family transcriptional regulator